MVGNNKFLCTRLLFYLIYTYQEFNIQAEIDGTISGSSEYHEIEREEYDIVYGINSC